MVYSHQEVPGEPEMCGVKLKGCDERGKGQILAVFINSVVVNLDRPRIKGS